MKKYYPIILSLVIMAFFSSCNQAKKENAGFTVERIDLSDTTYMEQGAADSPKFEAEISLYEIKMESQEAADNINRAIAYTVIDKDTTPIAAVCREYIDTRKREFLLLRPDYIELKNSGEEFFWLSHSYSVNSEIVTGYKGYINYIIYFYEFTGGAHPSSWCTVLNFDPENGNEIVIEDLIKENGEEEITNMLKAGIARHFGVETFDEVKENGFLFDDEVPLASNFIAGKDSFTFIYNKYEIAPYAAGEITVDIAVEDIKNILK